MRGLTLWILLLSLYSFQAPAQELSVCPEQSLVTVFVDRKGGLSLLGHQHLISIHTLTGKVRMVSPLEKSSAELKVVLAELRVDTPKLRKAAGMQGSISEKSIVKTKRNMLEKVLTANVYPEVTINITSIVQHAQNDQITIVSRIDLHGQAVDIQIPASLEYTESTLRSKGHFKINQSDFGIKPFRALLGALSVADELVVEFNVVAAKECN